MKKLNMKKAILMGIAGGTMLASQGHAASNNQNPNNNSSQNSQNLADGCSGKHGCHATASRDVPNHDNMPQDDVKHDDKNGQNSGKLSNGCAASSKNNPVASSCGAKHSPSNAQNMSQHNPSNGVYTQWETSDAGQFRGQQPTANSCAGAPNKQRGYTADNSKMMTPTIMPEPIQEGTGTNPNPVNPQMKK